MFGRFCFFQLHFHICKAVSCWKHYKNSIFSSRAQLLCITDSKTPFEGPLPKMVLLQPKVPFWVFPCGCWYRIFVVFSDFVWSHKRDIFQKQIAATKMCAFFTFWTQIVFTYFSQNCQLNKKTFFLSQPPKNTIFCVFVCFPFPFVQFFSFAFSNIRKTKTKNALFIWKPFFDTPSTCKKKSHPYTLFVI